MADMKLPYGTVRQRVEAFIIREGFYKWSGCHKNDFKTSERTRVY